MSAAIVEPATGGEMEFHPAASIFPLMGTADADALAADIFENTLLEPIVTLGGMILDGRNRYLACRKAGVEPEFREGLPFLCHDATAYVLSKNLHRRHLTTSQRAMVAARLATLGDGQHKSATAIAVAQPEAAKLLNVSTDSVQRARVVCKEATPGDIAAVERGEKTVNEVLTKVRPPKPHPSRKGEDWRERKAALSKALNHCRPAIHEEVAVALHDAECGVSHLLHLKEEFLRDDREAIKIRAKTIIKVLTAVLTKAAS